MHTNQNYLIMPLLAGAPAHLEGCGSFSRWMLQGGCARVASAAKPAVENAKLGALAEGARNPIFTANHSGPVCSKCHGSAAIWECVFTSTCVSLLLMCLEPVLDVQGMLGYILST